MSDDKIQFFKENWLTMANLVILLTLSFRVGVTLTTVERSIEDNTKAIENHIDNADVHQRFSDKIRVFVPRVELDSRLKNIEEQLDRIEGKVK